MALYLTATFSRTQLGIKQGLGVSTKEFPKIR
jgi:hypothetical protein